MIIINDFFVRYKEAVSNQMELISKRNNAKIISATRFMGQKSLQDKDKKDNIYIYNPTVYVFMVIREVIKNPKEIVHVFEEEPSFWKRLLFNFSNNPLFVSMYRRPNEKYAKHLKAYRNLKKVFVELESHKELLIKYGVPKEKIKITPTPSKIPRKKSEKKFNSTDINILFASWNNKEGNAIKERGLEYLLQLLQENYNFSLTIPLRDNDTQKFEELARDLEVWDRVKLLNINNNTELLIELFDKSDFVAFVPQKRVVKDVPNSLIDGIVRGKPIIISDIIDFSNTVKERNIGYVIKKGEKGKNLEILLEEYKEMSKRAYEYSKLHLQENYITIIESAYHEIKEETIKSELKRTLKEKYNLNIERIEKNEQSTEGNVYIIYCKSERYVVKIYNSIRHTEAMIKLHRKLAISNINVPNIILTKQNEYYATILEKNYFVVYSFLEGKQIAHILQLGQLNTEIIHAIAREVKKMHKITSKENEFDLPLVPFGSICKNQSVVHFDLTKNNIFINDNNEIGFIDFDDAKYGDSVCDIAILIANLFFSKTGVIDLEGMQKFIDKYYEDAIDLKKIEIPLIKNYALQWINYILERDEIGILNKESFKIRHKLINEILI